MNDKVIWENKQFKIEIQMINGQSLYYYDVQ